MPAVRDNGDQIDPLAKPQSLFVPKGTEFIMYTGSLHYNREWSDLQVSYALELLITHFLSTGSSVLEGTLLLQTKAIPRVRLASRCIHPVLLGSKSMHWSKVGAQVFNQHRACVIDPFSVRFSCTRFAEVECIGMISMLLKRFRITVDENRFPTILNETPLARRERLFESFQALSLTPKRIPLVFTRR